MNSLVDAGDTLSISATFANAEVPTLHRLATKTDFFTARVSACARGPTALPENFQNS